MTSPSAAATLPPIAVQAKPPAADPPKADGGHHGFSAVFHTLLDIVNPLQHIPVISTIYRHLTGDEISPVAKVAGGALYGGLIGLGLSVADVVVEEATGEDTGEHVLALFEDKKSGAPEPAASGTQLAQAAVPAPSPAAATAVDGQKWFPAFPSGSTHPRALSFAQKPAAAAAAPTTGPAQPVAQAAAEPVKATPAPSSAAGSAAVPQMDRATFDALLRSFGSQAVAGLTPAPAGADEAKPKPRNAAGEPVNVLGAARADSAVPANTGPAAARGYAAALQAMEAALDRYQAQGGRIPPPAVMPRGAAAM